MPTAVGVDAPVAADAETDVTSDDLDALDADAENAADTTPLGVPDTAGLSSDADIAEDEATVDSAQGTAADASLDACTNCDDGNACTVDQCSGSLCSHVAQDGPCSDGNACTLGDFCSQGTCQAGVVKTCPSGTGITCASQTCNVVSGKCEAGSDFNPAACKIDECDSTPVCCDGTQPPLSWCDGVPLGNCVHGYPDYAACEATSSGSPCLTSLCKGSATLGYYCAKGLAKTGPPCNDANPCTVNDFCLAGGCVGGGWLTCDDANACTQDSCVSAQGCAHVALPNGTTCGSAQACSAGTCK